MFCMANLLHFQKWPCGHFNKFRTIGARSLSLLYCITALRLAYGYSLRHRPPRNRSRNLLI